MFGGRRTCRRGLTGLGVLLAVALVGGLLAARAQAYVYWSHDNATAVRRADLGGTIGSQSFIAGATNPAAVAVDSQHIYWANNDGTIRRANLDGTGVNQSSTAAGSFPDWVTIDGGPQGDASANTAAAFNAQPLPGASCMIDVRFGPSAIGPRSVTLAITSNDPLSPLLISLSGTVGQLPQGRPDRPAPRDRSGPAGQQARRARP
jgi:hypothetical protein